MNVAWEISHAFTTGELDLTLRQKAPPVGWQSLPETVMAEKLRAAGEGAVLVRLSSTFLAAMDRARDANQLWDRGLRRADQVSHYPGAFPELVVWDHEADQKRRHQIARQGLQQRPLPGDPASEGEPQPPVEARRNAAARGTCNVGGQRRAGGVSRSVACIRREAQYRRAR